MAFSRSVKRSQAPAKCGICETERPIKWKCIDCDNLLCDNCKEKVHPKFQNAKNHQVVNIKDVGQPTVLELNVNKQYQTELTEVDYITYCSDGSLWISCERDKVLQKVKPEGTKLTILSSFNTKVLGMAVTHSNDLLLCTGETRLKQIKSDQSTITDSVYDVSPLNPTAVYITSNNKVLVGAVNLDMEYEEIYEETYFVENRVVHVILMSQSGEHERMYKMPHQLMTYPYSITRTSNGNTYLVNFCDEDINRLDRNSVVVLEQDDDIINIYTADDDDGFSVNFDPGQIVKTPADKVMVADSDTSTLQILNNSGQLMTSYKTSDINIIYPYSLAFTPTGKLYIGCKTPECACPTEEDLTSKIYEVNISGC